MRNKLLAATQNEIEGNLQGRTKADCDKVVAAGAKAAMQGGPNSPLAKLKGSKDPIHDCVVGAINLAIILRKQSRNSMPLKAMISGATILMLHALDFAETAGIVQIDKPELDQATHLLVNTLFKRLGITPAMIHTAAGKANALMQNPVSVARMRFAAGMTKHPNSPIPTPVPGEDEAKQPEGEAA